MYVQVPLMSKEITYMPLPCE